MRLENTVALITGASRGIGGSIASLFSSHGANVVINYHQSREAAYRLAAELISMYGVDPLVIQADVSDKNQVKQMTDVAMEKYGKIDILVNNAGITRRGSLQELTEQDWDYVLNVNLKGAFLCAQSLAPIMLDCKKGSIVNIASMRGIAGSEKSMNYAISKAGVIALTKCLAIELAPYIRVNCVAPGYTLTEIHSDKTQTQISQICDQIPLKRFATVEEIASSVLFLASDDSSYITGETLLLSGGLVLQ